MLDTTGIQRRSRGSRQRNYRECRRWWTGFLPDKAGLEDMVQVLLEVRNESLNISLRRLDGTARWRGCNIPSRLFGAFIDIHCAWCRRTWIKNRGRRNNTRCRWNYRHWRTSQRRQGIPVRRTVRNFIVEGKPQQTLWPPSIFIGSNALVVVFPLTDFPSNKNPTTLRCIGRKK